MKIGIFCPKDSISATRIKLEAESRDYTCRRMRTSDLLVEIDENGLKVSHRKFDLNEFDIFIFRRTSNIDNEIISSTSKYLVNIGKKVIDQSILETNNQFTELENLAKSGSPILKRAITTSKKSARDLLMEFEHPVIVKPLDLPSERYTFSEDWTESYDIVRTEKSRVYEFMEAVDNESYIKVYAVGQKIIGAILKKNLDAEKKLNLSKKTKVSRYTPDETVNEIVLKAIKSMHYEMCSVDLVETENGWKIIEIDRSPKFASFNKVHQEKFEKNVIDYLELLLNNN